VAMQGQYSCIVGGHSLRNTKVRTGYDVSRAGSGNANIIFTPNIEQI
jgi:hypothetical protein